MSRRWDISRRIFRTSARSRCPAVFDIESSPDDLYNRSSYLLNQLADLKKKGQTASGSIVRNCLRFDMVRC
jgi:hypothetical protein